MPPVGLFGRDESLAKLARLFAESARFVTLSGSAGVGKSRLAASFAASGQASVTAACDLASARTPSDLWRAVAQALDAPLGSTTVGDASSRVLGRVLDQRGAILLLLDNIDPLFELATPTLVSWMHRAPELRFLTTSRERLRLADEHVVLVDGLVVPGTMATMVEIAASPAVQLFEDRTRRVRSDFALTDATAPIVAELVRNLDGNPLAIELCAARGATLGPSQLLSMSRQRPEALSAGALRTAIERSWELLAPADRAALACFSVFTGGFELEAAERLLAQTAISTDPTGGVEALARLVDKSLVRADEIGSGRLRYRLYAAVREYASDKLDDPLRSSAERAHAAYFAELGASWAQLAEEGAALQVAEQAGAEFDNLLRAHAWALAQQGEDTEAMSMAASIALALEPVFLTKGPADGYAGLLDAMLSQERFESLAPSSLARLHVARGLVHVAQGAHAAAQDAYERAVSSAVCAKEASVEAFALSLLAASHIARARYDLGDDALARARLALDGTNAPRVRAFFHRTRAYRLARDNRAEDALAEYEAALGLLRGSKDPREAAILLGQMGVRHHELGNLVESRNLLERAIGVLVENGERRYAAHFSGQLGAIDLEDGDLTAAESRSRDAIDQLRAIGDTHLEAWLVAQLGNVEFLRGDVALATRRYTDALILLDEVGDVLVGGLVRLRSAMALASLGHVDESVRELMAAERALQPAGARFFTLLRIANAQIDLSRARAAGQVRPSELTEDLRNLEECSGLDSHARFALQVLARGAEGQDSKRSGPPQPVAADGERPGIAFAPDASWFAKPGAERVTLGRRGALRKIAARMLADRVSKPGVALSVLELFEVGWPGQRTEYELACNRVYAAVSRLRSMGLGAALVTRDDGYLLDAGTQVRIEASD